jgi:hypothetical protein
MSENPLEKALAKIDAVQGNGRLAPQTRSAEVIEYEATGNRAPPTLKDAIGVLAQSVDLSIMKDVIFEFDRNRAGEVHFRFRCYR